AMLPRLCARARLRVARMLRSRVMVVMVCLSLAVTPTDYTIARTSARASRHLTAPRREKARVGMPEKEATPGALWHPRGSVETRPALVHVLHPDHPVGRELSSQQLPINWQHKNRIHPIAIHPRRTRVGIGDPVRLNHALYVVGDQPVLLIPTDGLLVGDDAGPLHHFRVRGVLCEQSVLASGADVVVVGPPVGAVDAVVDTQSLLCRFAYFLVVFALALQELLGELFGALCGGGCAHGGPLSQNNVLTQ